MNGSDLKELAWNIPPGETVYIKALDWSEGLPGGREDLGRAVFSILMPLSQDSIFQEGMTEDNLRSIQNALDLAESFILLINIVRHFSN